MNVYELVNVVRQNFVRIGGTFIVLILGISSQLRNLLLQMMYYVTVLHVFKCCSFSSAISLAVNVSVIGGLQYISSMKSMFHIGRMNFVLLEYLTKHMPSLEYFYGNTLFSSGIIDLKELIINEKIIRKLCFLKRNHLHISQ